jgi:hypothetical protein
MSNKPTNKITGKELIKNMSEFREMYMIDYLRNTSQVGGSEDTVLENQSASELSEREKNFLEVRYFY